MATELEYLAEQARLKTEYEKAIQNLGFEYAKSQRKFQIGDIIQKKDTITRLESFGWTYGSQIPQPIYKGTILTKKLEPVKKGDKTSWFYGNDGIELVKAKE